MRKKSKEIFIEANEISTGSNEIFTERNEISTEKDEKSIETSESSDIVTETIDLLGDCVVDRSSPTETITLLEAALINAGYTGKREIGNYISGNWTRNLKIVKNVKMFLEGVWFARKRNKNEPV